jgi:ADP-ribose pyrophosphatase YjhB (NUDIX family)
MSCDVAIIALADVRAVYDPAPWAFAEERRAEIDALWAQATAGKPKLFNGIVLMQHRWTIRDGVYEAGYAPVDYASFTAWPQLGKPGPARRNGFAMAALRSADGAFILGVMGEQTFNAGKVYFPGGTPDMGDVTPDGRVDLAGSMIRELKEETGLRDGEFTVDPAWTVVTEGHRAAFLKPARLACSADEARRIILSRLAEETDQELADIAIVREPRDIDEAMTPTFAKAYMRSVFAAEQALTPDGGPV